MTRQPIQSPFAELIVQRQRRPGSHQVTGQVREVALHQEGQGRPLKLHRCLWLGKHRGDRGAHRQVFTAQMVRQFQRFHSLFHGPLAVQGPLEIVLQDYIFRVRPLSAALVAPEFAQILRRRADCPRTAAKQHHSRKQAMYSKVSNVHFHHRLAVAVGSFD